MSRRRVLHEEDSDASSIDHEDHRNHIKSLIKHCPFDPNECAAYFNEYAAGSILRVRLVNFQKYTECTIYPGPYMNMVMGPNGTGKSTIVGAIALGLGWSPSVLGRSKDLGEFIKYGEEKAMIEIVLKTDESVSDVISEPEDEEDGGVCYNYVVIRRVMTRGLKNVGHQSCTSEYFMNGNKSTISALQKLTARLNIQVDNLCQFLPQDKVSEFAKMTPVEMLMATEEATAGTALIQDHRKLIEFRKQQRTLESEYDRNAKSLELNNKELTKLEDLFEKIQEREARVEKIKLARKKRPWLEYNEARQAYMQAKATRDTARQEYERQESASKPIRESIAELKAKQKSSEKERQTFTTRNDQIRRQIENSSRKQSEAAEAITEKRQEILAMRAAKTRRMTEMEQLRGQIRQLEEKTRQQPDESELDVINTQINEKKRAMEELEGPLNDLEVRQTRISSEGEKLNRELNGLSGKLRELDDVKRQKLETLKRFNPDAHKAYEWLESNRGMFNGPVLGPIGLEVEAKHANLAAALESCIPRSSMISFVCTNEADQELFMQKMTDQMGLQINCIGMNENARHGGLGQYRRILSDQELKKLGFDCLVLDCLEGPEDVLMALCENVKINMIPVSTRNDGTNLDLDACSRVQGLMKFVTTENFFELKRSRYNSDFATKCAPLKNSVFLGGSGDVSGRQELMDQITERRGIITRNAEIMKEIYSQMQQLRAQKDKLEGSATELNNQRLAIYKARTDYFNSRKSLDLKRRNLSELTNTFENDFDETETLDELKTLIQERSEILLNLTDATDRFHRLLSQFFATNLQYTMNAAEIGRLEIELVRADAQFNEFKAELEVAEERLQRAKVRAKEMLERASEEELTEEMKSAFESLPETLVDLDDLIASEEALLRLTSTGELTPAALEDFKNKQKSTADLQAVVEDLDVRRSDLRERIRKISEPWLTQLNTVIARVNDNFRVFFARIACEGQVRLQVPTDASDYDQYELAIMVSFRLGEAMQRLTAQRQSGGEKSVSTILYLLALQELSKSPFRVVDEINQGMDASNERRIHSLIVETATRTAADGQSATSQYFLITPKLLTGLEYHERMHVLCVYNGPGLPEPAEMRQVTY